MTLTQPSGSLPRRLLLAAALLGASVALPTYASPPPWAPAHGHRAKQVQEYRYVYYPEQQVYYAPESSQWFWLSGGSWQFGVSLPSQFGGFSVSGGVPVVLNSSRPYVEHVYVEQHYGQPWREKHKKPKKQRHGDYDSHQDRHSDRDRNRGPHGHRD